MPDPKVTTAAVPCVLPRAAGSRRQPEPGRQSKARARQEDPASGRAQTGAGVRVNGMNQRGHQAPEPTATATEDTWLRGPAEVAADQD